jgi:plasmid stabilization system protein ParE
MKPLKVAPAMTADLQQAYDYFKRGGSTAAERFLIRYEEAMRAVQLHPEICRVRPSG